MCFHVLEVFVARGLFRICCRVMCEMIYDVSEPVVSVSTAAKRLSSWLCSWVIVFVHLNSSCVR